MFQANLTRTVARSSLKTLQVPVSRGQGYATTPPPPSGQPAPNPKAKESNNTMLYSVLGLGAAAGAYLYFRNPDEVKDIKKDVRTDKARLEQKGQEAVESAKAYADDKARLGERKFDDLKQGSQERMEAARSRAEDAARVFEARGKSIGEDIEGKYDALKASSRDNIAKARDSTENLYNEAKSTASQKARDAREEADKKAEQAKEGWSGWLGWGKSKADKGVDEVVSESERLKRDGAQRVANTAEDVRRRAEKHS